ncbi:MAG TPA: hypothetical protein VGQ01_04300 [Actinomycetota bacterium]|nr:hypothetical protein [Actinomycetota bacterium]
MRTTSVLSERLEDVVPQLEGHARPVFLDRDDRALFDQRPVVLLRLLPTLLGKLALGDVEHHALEQRVALSSRPTGIASSRIHISSVGRA